MGAAHEPNVFKEYLMTVPHRKNKLKDRCLYTGRLDGQLSLRRHPIKLERYRED